MKKYFPGIMAIILAIGFSAFNINHFKEPVGSKIDYTWHKYNPAGTAELSPVVTYFGSAAGAKTAFGCPDGTTVNCARAYDMDGNALSIYVKKSPQ